MKSKKIISVMVSLLLVIAINFSLGACGQQGSNGGQKIDKNRTQLYVSNFAGGYGDEWLYALAARFEEFYKDVSFEPDHPEKKGVQIMFDSEKVLGTDMINEISTSRNEVFFSESVYYYDYLREGLFADITDIVSGENSDLAEYGDVGTIEDKMNTQQKEYYKSDGKYYAIPHYSAYSGIIYDVDLFEQEGWYLAYDQDNNNDGFIRPNNANNEKLSLGPDGKTEIDPETGVDYSLDDGLPATYDEFFRLCDYIVSTGNTPVIWTGKDNNVYLKRLLQALATDYEGAQQMLLNYNFNGYAENLVASIDNGVVTKRTPAVKIENSNGYELYTSAGRYYALTFLERLIDNPKYWHSDGFTNTESHLDAQDNFLFSRKENKYIGMLFDGIWWENEADATFKEMANSDVNMSRLNRRIGFMPYPKATTAEVGEKMTVVDTHYALGFINANITEEWKLDLAKKFLKFANTNQSLSEFTVITNTPKSLNYTVSEEDQEKMSYFGRNLLRVKETADIVYPYSTNEMYMTYQTNFEFTQSFEASINGRTYNNVGKAMHDNNITAEEFFYGIQNLYNQDAWNQLYEDFF